MFLYASCILSFLQILSAFVNRDAFAVQISSNKTIAILTIKVCVQLQGNGVKFKTG